MHNKNMKIPNNNQAWEKEIFNAYEEAVNLLNNGNTLIGNIENIFRLAPILAANNREITNEVTRIEMLEYVVECIEQDFSVDEDSKENYLFHFVISYIHAHVAVELVGEMEGDRIMEYINANNELFENA